MITLKEDYIMKSKRNDNDVESVGDHRIDLSDRREFLKKAGKTALITPAVALLVDASLKAKKADAEMYQYDPGGWIP